MSKRVLFVDDDPHILSSFRTALGRRYKVDTALGAEEAFAMIANNDTYKVVVSDLKMPGMDGVEFLSRVSKISPKSIRIMLTGFADVESAMSAVNQGRVFRFLTKPSSTDTMVGTIEAALEQYRLQNLEKELLRSTLWGSVKMLTEILSLVNPEAFGRSERVKRLVSAMAKELKLGNSLKYELAAMLSQIGCVSVPEDILAKKYAGQPLTAEEQQIYGMNVSVAVSLLSNIPRLEEVGKIIACQTKEDCKSKESSTGGLLLKLALEFDDLSQRGLGRETALAELSLKNKDYGPDALRALERALLKEEGYKLLQVSREELAPGMILAHDLRTHEGSLLLAKGLELSRYMLERLDSLARTRSVREPIEVLIPGENA